MTTTTPHGIKLAVHLISTYFGDIVSKVCDCLLNKGPLSQILVIKYTHLTKQQVTKALLVLIHHNCVQAFNSQLPGSFGAPPKIVTQYMALYDNIIHHMRFPKFSSIVSNEFGQDCAYIFDGLLQHGRLSMNQIMDRSESYIKNRENGNASNVLYENFNKLAQARFIERCPAVEPFLEPQEDAPKKRGAKTKIGDVSQTLEARALAAAAPMESLRFLVESDALINGALNNDDDDIKKSPTTSIVGEKRKQDCLESETENWATNKNKEILWRANFEEFVRCLRYKACVSHVTERIDSVAGIVLHAVFEANRRDETKVKMEKTVPLLLQTIFDEAMKTEEGRSLTLERVRAALVQLGCELPTIAINETYSIDLKKIIDQAQAQEVESIVMKKYGRESYRMFRLLAERERFIETDKIASTTFVEKQDALIALFKLWKDDFLHLERIGNGNDAQKSEAMLWKLNKRSVWEQVLDDMYHAALNLKLRIVHENDLSKDSLLVVKGTADDAAMKNRLRAKWKVLEASLFILDDAIMLLHDF
ncbi:uncharacterized protein LOC143569667 [Bidens hawaiensis]|uniref:uncharacterized protein LOC143569667 n=1 Tax=Bidens hawaiensis TaxID=980011 RepID=UPI00404906D5